MDGYTTVIHRIAKYILDENIKLSFKPIAIFPNAETLTDLMRYDIEKAFNCSVRNQYASSEGAPFITENKTGELEINAATGVFEFEQVHGNVYELIVTGFYTTTTPLLRYRIGDSVELETELPVDYKQKDVKIKRIIGRNNDFLLSRENGIVTNVNLSTAIRFVGNDVVESQFVQNEIDNITVYLVINNNADKNNIIKRLRYELKFRFGTSTNFHFEFVDKIPFTSGGKKRFAINNIK